jgi:putative ABC transport system permease protein
MIQDARFALRVMRKQPLFTAIAVATLALGIGANTAIFSVVHAVLLERISYPPTPDRVLFMNEANSRMSRMSVSYPGFKDWQRLNQSFQVMAGYRDMELNLVGTEQPMRLETRCVSFGYFELQGVSPLLGRFFLAEEDRPGAPNRLVLSYDLWVNRFGAAPDVVGDEVRLDDDAYTVIGVLPKNFELANEERAYIALDPVSDNESARNRGNHQGIFVLARMRDDVSFDEAKAEMEAIERQLEQEYPASNSGILVTVKRLSDARVEDYARTLETLMAAVSLVLLIACANVANLLLARGVSRSRDTAIQSALGAGRLRLIRRGLTEAVVLASFGGSLGVVLAFSGLAALQNILPADVPRLQHVGLNPQVLGYSLLLSFLTAGFFGMVPAFVNARPVPADTLKEGSRGSARSSAAGRGLLVAEVALATMLLVGAGLLIRSVSELTRVAPGFRPDHLLTLKVGLPESRYDDERRSVFLEQMREGLSSLPGVQSTTVGLNLPMMGASWNSVFVVGDHGRSYPARCLHPWPPGISRPFPYRSVRAGCSRRPIAPVLRKSWS